MNTSPPSHPVSRRSETLLFISYAVEDRYFAEWLARKLAYFGYGVWIDQIKLLGGESWVKEVDIAIKERSFRVLGVLSNSSISKDNPRKERTLALQLAKERKIDDFLITLNLDGVKPDWTLSDISWIPFYESWADGLRRLLKKLDSLSAPRIHVGNPGIANATMDAVPDLLIRKPEPLTTNLLPFTQLPEALSVFDWPNKNIGNDEENHVLWPHYSLGKETSQAVAFFPPPDGLAHQVKKIQAYHWPSAKLISGVETHVIVSNLLKRHVHSWLVRSGCQVVFDTRRSYYIPALFRNESVYRFQDVDGSSSYIRTHGLIRLCRPNTPPEEINHHPAVQYRIKKADWGGYVIQLRPCVALFDSQHNMITGRRVGPRVKKVTCHYYNEKWRKRLSVFAQLLLQESAVQVDGGLALGSLITLSADQALDEQLLIDGPVPSIDVVDVPEVQLGDGELEDEDDE